jgi:hypothetical protein
MALCGMGGDGGGEGGREGLRGGEYVCICVRVCV